jgi:hypothetical protein
MGTDGLTCTAGSFCVVPRFRMSCAMVAAFFMLVSFLAHSSTLKMEAIFSSETLVIFRWTTWRYITEDIIPQHFNFMRLEVLTAVNTYCD